MQALAHDVLNYSLNRVTLTEPGAEMGASAGKKKSRVCDLDSKDDFWVGNKGSPFPEVSYCIDHAYHNRCYFATLKIT